MITKAPRIVVAADWSVDETKRWTTRAELDGAGHYVVFPPEPVGELSTLLSRLRQQLAAGESLLLGFDFPIGLPAAYARRTGISRFRSALAEFGRDEWRQFFTISNAPGIRNPFFPFLGMQVVAVREMASGSLIPANAVEIELLGKAKQAIIPVWPLNGSTASWPPAASMTHDDVHDWTGMCRRPANRKRPTLAGP